jgi:hypothetical protein
MFGLFRPSAPPTPTPDRLPEELVHAILAPAVGIEPTTN